MVRQRQLPARPSQRGASRLKLTGFLALVIGVIFVGVKVIPILVNNMQFQDAIENTARFASVNRQSVDDIRTAVLKEAQNEDIPIAANDIHVKGESGHVEIAAEYSVTVNLLVYQWTLNFHPFARNNPIL
jgi:predicted membrane protein